MTPARQPSLPFVHLPGYDPADFVPAPGNAEARAWLIRSKGWPDHRLLLWGEAGCGKTHLLHVWTRAAGAVLIHGPDLGNLEASGNFPALGNPPASGNLTALGTPPALGNLTALENPAALGNLPALGESPALEGPPPLGNLAALDGPLAPDARAIAIDDADQMPADIGAETTLLHLLNAARERGAPVLLASRQPPSRWPTCLPDLASRLRAITAVQVGPLDPTTLRILFVRLLADRQLRLDPVIQDWLLERLPQHPAALRHAAARLDHLAPPGSRRRISRTLAAAALDVPALDVELKTRAISPSQTEAVD